jgi:hypothetical protein
MFVRARPTISARLIEYPKFSNKNLLRRNRKYFMRKKKRPRHLNKRLRLKLPVSSRRPRCPNKRSRLNSFVFVRNRIRLIKKNKE